MFKLYNNYHSISRNLSKLFKNSNLELSSPHIKNINQIIISMIKSESIVTADISKNIHDNVNDASVQKRIYRFFNNSRFDHFYFWESIIKYVISNVSFKHNKAFITIDHSFSKNNFATLMFSLRVNNQCIPLYFISEKTKAFCGSYEEFINRKPFFSHEEITKGIDKVISYFNKDAKLIFLADRWFTNIKLMQHIQSKNAYFVIRVKQDSDLAVKIINNRTDKHPVWQKINKIHSQFGHSKYFKDVLVSKHKFKTNIIATRNLGSSDPWYLLSNCEPQLASKYYAKRFGSIETLFKNTKTNGFNLEKTKTKNIKAFETMYTILCFSVLWLVIIGVDYVKNKHNYKHKLNITVTKKTKTGFKKRILSDFNLGLTIFHKTYESSINFKIKTDFKLYV